MAVNKMVVQWYGDQIVTYILLLEAIILLCIMIKNHETNKKHPLSFKILLYAVYVMAICYAVSLSLCYIALPISSSLSPNSNQLTICQYIWVPVFLFFGATHLCIVNLFMTRLQMVFKNSLYEVSKRTNYTFRIAWASTMVIVLIFCAWFIDPTPYNIYKQEIDSDGNAVTCSSYAKQPSLILMILLGLAGITIVCGNVVVWLLFTTKLYKLLKNMHMGKAPSSKQANGVFMNLMKNQTFCVGIAAFTTIFAWMIQSTSGLFGQVFGQMMVPLDFGVSIFAIFMSFGFNRYYFELFKCDLFVKYCCKCFETYIVKHVSLTKDETKIAQNISNSSIKSDDIQTVSV